MSHEWRSLVPVTALVLTALVIGLLNNVAIAALFGLTREVDAFYAAMMLPSLFMFLCVDYLGKNFLPVLALARKEGDASASQMISTVVTLMAGVAALTAFTLAGASRALFTLMLPGFHPQEITLVTHYFWIMAPAMVLMAINTFHEYVCQYDEHFVPITAIRLALPAMNLAALVLLGPFLHEFCLPVGYVAGHVAMFVLLARRARYAFRPCFTIRKHLERKIFANTAIVMSTGLLARTKSVVINVLASSLGDGAIATLAFATKITEPLERAAFSGAKMCLFSRAARLFADDKITELGALYRVAVRLAFLVFVPALWWVVFHSDSLVTLMFARGEFTPRMGALVAAALAASAPSVLFSGVAQLLANAFYAMGRVKMPALILPFGMVVFVAGAATLARTFGTQGIALATTLSAVSVFGMLLATLSRTIKDSAWRSTTLQLLGYCVLGGVIMGAVTSVANQLGVSPFVSAIVTLPAGTLLYCAVLSTSGDRAFGMVTRAGRQWLTLRRLNA